jgi:hypothetical protein
MADRDFLTEAATALYGPDWRLPLSRLLSVNERTVRRWASGVSRVPEGIWSKIGKACEAHSVRLREIARKLR